MLSRLGNLRFEDIPPPRDERQPIRGLLDFTRSAKSVGIDSEDLIDHWKLFNPCQFASLESILLLRRTIQVARRRDPTLEAHFFGEDPKAALFVNIDKPAVDKITEWNKTSRLKLPYSKWFSLDDFGYNTDWPKFCSEKKARLEATWLQKQFEWHPWTVSDPRDFAQHTEKWMEAMKGPEFGLVTMICLSQSEIGD